MDFAADIADFKRRMFLSVILLHRFNDDFCLNLELFLCSPNASESLINAASEAHNFQVVFVAIKIDISSS